jgi:hypothetical protein
MDDKVLDRCLGAAYVLLKESGHVDASDLLRTSSATIQHDDYDNINGGTNFWSVMLEVPAPEFARLRSRIKDLEKQITEALGEAIPPTGSDYYAAKLVPIVGQDEDWRASATVTIPRNIRRNILDGLRLEQVNVFGVLNDPEFLSRIYELRRLPSTDSRYKDAAGDIYQHRVNNDDWDEYWIFDDDRFPLLDGPADTFLRFLGETVHPVVRPDREEAAKIVGHYNDQLRQAGWELVEVERIAGRSRYEPQQLSSHGHRTFERGKSVADALDAGAIAKQIQRMEYAIEKDPELAIGSAKELVESCCKTILRKLNVEIGKSDDMNDLAKKLAKSLDLVPEGIDDQAKGADCIKRILSNLNQIAGNLANLRRLYGTGHGKDGKHRGLQPRHARLAVTSAVAFVDFVTATYEERMRTKPGQ